MMTKLKSIWNKVTSFGERVVSLFKARSISTQLILTIILIFASFFALQALLNNIFFSNYYTDQEFQRINTSLMEYIDAMNAENSDYYNEMYDYTTENNAYSIIVNGQYHIITSSFTDYTLTIQDTATGEDIRILVPNNAYDYELNEIISVKIFEFNDELFSPAQINTANGRVYNADVNCTDNPCTTVLGPVVEINKPNNLNYLADENALVQREIEKLNTNQINLDDYKYVTGSVEGYWYRSSDGPVDSLVFVHHLNQWNRIVTIVPIVDTNNIINIVSSYNYYVYATAIVIILLWSFRLSSIISNPIQNIELVAREIAQLNFNVEAHEYNNRENESLSKSINLIAKNLKNTLQTVNTKNRELLELYEEQSKQVTLKKQLVSSISHELKTPLMIMQVTIQGILDDIIPEEDQVKELNNVIDEINKSSMMIQDMLQIYRLDDANTQLELGEFDLSKVVYFFIHDFENAIKNYRLNIDINIQDEVYLEADEKLIKRVISNFFTNAIKYTPIGGEMYIEVSNQDNFVYFELTNYGSNIDSSDIEKIWLPFYRIDHEGSNPLKTKGSGIGLYLVSEILKAHEAEFGIENVKNGVKAYFKIKSKKE
jgi:signal transduction histidine kinase